MKTNKILSNILVAGIFLVPFIPFIVPGNMFFPFITGKNFTFRILVEILFGAWLVLAYNNPAYRPSKSPLVIAIASFVGIIAVAGMFGENPFKSFWSNYERMEGTVSLIHFFAYFLVTATVLRARDKWNAFINISLFAGFLMGVYALFQVAGSFEIHQGSTRVDATLGNSAYLAVYMLFNIFLALYMMLRTKGQDIAGRIADKASVWIYTPLILLFIFTLYYTATRGAILGLIAGLFLTAVLVAIFEKERLVLKKSAIGLLFILVVFVSGFLALKDKPFISQNQVLSRFSSISLTETTTMSRFMVWNMAYQGFKERPILGWGQENFNYVFNKYYDPKMYAQEPWFDRAHNVFFDWLIAGGILGLLSYLSIFAVALRYLWRKTSRFSVVEKSILTGLFAGYFFQNIFVFDNLMSYVLFFSVLAFIEGTRSRDEITTSAKSKKKGAIPEANPFDFAVPITAVILVVSALYFFNAKPIATNIALIDALTPKGKPMVNLEDFKKAISYNSLGTTEAREQLTKVTLQILGAEKVGDDVKKAFAELALSEMKKQVEVHPNDARYQLFLGSFLSQLGKYSPAIFDEAIVVLKKAHELSPKKQAILFELGSVYYNKKDLANAEKMFKQAYDLAPEFSQAEGLYLQILMENKNYSEIEVVLKAHIARDPKDSDPHTRLSALYFAQGKRADAIAEIEISIKLNPAFKDQGESYIRDIKAGKQP